MNVKRAISSGALIWLYVFSLFAVLSFVPVIKESEALQAGIIGIFLIPVAAWGADSYYKKGDKKIGLPIAIIMVATALILDLLITVPFFEIPYNNRGYSAFFSNSLLWILVVENMTIIYLYWRLRVRI